MNKRLFSIFIVIAILLSGCSRKPGVPKEPDSEKWVPELASEEIRPYAEQAIKTIDSYLAFEITKKEAVNTFRELDSRINSFDIPLNENDYNEADEAIEQSITMLSFDSCTDAEYHKHRDILKFQIGEKVGVKKHKPEQYINEKDEIALKRYVDFSTIPFEYGSIYYSEDSGQLNIVLFFDRSAGVFSFNIVDYIKDIYAELTLKKNKSARISIYYNYFEQPVFGVLFKLDNGNITGQAYRRDSERNKLYEQFKEKYSDYEISRMEEYPEEFKALNPLFEFDSIDGLEDYVYIVAQFVG